MNHPEAPETFPPWRTGAGSVCKRPFTSHSQGGAILHSIRRGETHTLENLQLLKAVTLLGHNSKEAPPDNKSLLERKLPYTGKLAYSQIKEPFVPYQKHRLSDEISIWEKIETLFGATFHFKPDRTSCTLYLASGDYFPYCIFLSSICFSIFMLEK